jgi:vancomycin resistance protein YoaR
MISEMKKIKILGFFGLGILVGLVLLIGIARLTWHSKFYPGVSIAGVSVSGLTREQARVKLTEMTDNYQAKLVFNGSEWEAPKGAVGFEIEATLNMAYHHGRRARIEDYLLLLINRKTDYPLLLSEGKTEKFVELISEIASVIEMPPIEPIVEVVGNKIKITNGIDGVIMAGEELDRQIKKNYAYLNSGTIVIPIQVGQRQLTQDELAQLKTRAETLIGKNLVMTQDDERIKLGGKELIALLSQASIVEYVDGLSESLKREPQDARFEFSEGKVKEFAPGRDGIMVNGQWSMDNIREGIRKLLETESKSETVEIAVTRTPPKVTTEKVNELGIRERIGRGESYYAHSIPNRIFNVGLVSSRANSALIAPGEEFSFNRIVGEISGATGYREAYVISGGRTVLGDGGGVCQVSTTLFRAAMAAGLPITERWAHAYRVGYYEQNSKAGIDATVYAPSKDLRFLNDTPGHILVQLINDPKYLHLVVEIYGTSDGRVATISEPRVWGVSPPPPDIVQEDPSLPAGTTKQVDWSAWGAKTSFEYRVVRNGETLQEKTYTSSYRPWANVYLKGTGI